MLEEVKKLDGSLFFCWVQRGFVGDERLVTRSYDLVVGTFDVFWDLFQVLFSGFISGLEGWGVRVRVGFLSMF